MGTLATTEQIAKASPSLRARIAGAFFLLAVLTAVFGEFVAGRGKVAVIAGLIAVGCYIAVTLVLYGVFKPVNRNIFLLAASFNFAGLALEALRWNPRGVDIAMVFHGLYCLLIGYLAYRSTFLPRILSAGMTFAGLIWLGYLSPRLAASLSPYNTAVGLLGEASLMLWLLVMGVNVSRWRERESPAEFRT